MVLHPYVHIDIFQNFLELSNVVLHYFKENTDLPAVYQALIWFYVSSFVFTKNIWTIEVGPS
jgi:hypothetical protein